MHTHTSEAAMGRPKMDEGEARDERIVLRARADERERWTSAAKRAGLTLSDWLRGLADRASAQKSRAKR